MKKQKLPIVTREGEFIAHYSEQGLARLDFPAKAAPRARKEKPDVAPSPQIMRWHAQTTKALQSALAGKAPRVLPPLDISEGTSFQQTVWAALLKIATGRTRSYAEIAAVIGRPKAMRAVGGACGANPIPVLIPCHRVLASDHSLGGFSGGLYWKLRLLTREGAFGS